MIRVYKLSYFLVLLVLINGCGGKLKSPEKVRVEKITTKSLSLAWEKVKGAKEYSIFRSGYQNQGYKKIADSNSANYKDKDLVPGLIYFYKIQATNGKKKSDFSGVLKAITYNKNLFKKFWENKVDNKTAISSVAFLKDDFIAAGGFDNTIKLYNLINGDSEKTLKGHTLPIFTIDFSSKKDLIASGGADKTIKIWDTKYYALVRTVSINKAPITVVKFTEDGEFLVVGSEDRTIKIFSTKNFDLIKSIEVETPILDLDIRKDNKYIVAGGGGRKIKIIEFDTGKIIKEIDAHKLMVKTVKYSYDGKMIISGSSGNWEIQDYDVKVWNAENGKLINELKGHKDSINSIHISQNNKEIITVSNDKTIRLWDLGTGELIKTLEGTYFAVLDAKMSNDGKYIVSGVGNNLVMFKR